MAFSELMTSVFVSLSVSCTVHVSKTGPDVYPLTSLQSAIFSVAVGGVLANDTERTTQIDSKLSSPVEGFAKLFSPRVNSIVYVSLSQLTLGSQTLNDYITNRILDLDKKLSLTLCI